MTVDVITLDGFQITKWPHVFHLSVIQRRYFGCVLSQDKEVLVFLLHKLYQR